jgi:hypothetical protein
MIRRRHERALAHPKVSKAAKKRLRDQHRTLDPVALLAEIRAAQEELGSRIDRRGINHAAPLGASFAKALVVGGKCSEARFHSRNLRKMLAAQVLFVWQAWQERAPTYKAISLDCAT